MVTLRIDDTRKRLKVESQRGAGKQDWTREETKTISEDKHWIWYHLREEESRVGNGRTVSTETLELSGQQKRKSMTELAGGELCLPQRPHNQVGAARRRRS